MTRHARLSLGAMVSKATSVASARLGRIAAIRPAKTPDTASCRSSANPFDVLENERTAAIQHCQTFRSGRLRYLSSRNCARIRHRSCAIALLDGLDLKIVGKRVTRVRQGSGPA